ncbi:hypothetical protein A7982_13678 [Minicystis rosea]|nr:hypothetical protein A7982_13678 [Minicystis rosea]
MSRVRYYNGEFLKTEEFTDDQSYHIDRRQRHERLLHADGVAEGLEVTIGEGGATINVSPGTAVDKDGQQILLPAAQTINVQSSWGDSMVVEIVFSEIETDPADSSNSIQSATRYEQNSAPTVQSAANPDAVHLARVTTNAPSFPRIATGVILTDRRYAGVRLPGPAHASGAAGTLRSQGDAIPGWAELGCSLSVAGAARVDDALTAGSASVTGASRLGAPSLPSGGGSYALAAGDLASSGKAFIGALSALPQAPPTLYVGGTASVTSNLAVGGSTSVAGASGLGSLGSYTLAAGDVAAANHMLVGALSGLPASPPALYVGGAASVTNNLSVGGTASVTNNLSVGGTASVTNNLSVGGTASVTSNLSVGGPASIAGASGLGSLGSYTLAAGDVAAANHVLIGTLSGLPTTPSRLYVGGDASVTGSSKLGSPSWSTGYALAAGDLASSGKALIGALSALPASPSTLYVGGTASVTSNISVGGAASVAGASGLGSLGSYTLAAGDVAAANHMLVGALSGLPASPPTLYVGGAASITGASKLGSPSWSSGYTLGTGDLASSGKALIGALSALPASPPALYVGGDATVTGLLTTGSATISGAATLNGASTLNGATTLNGTTSLGSDLFANGKKLYLGAADGPIVSGSSGGSLGGFTKSGTRLNQNDPNNPSNKQYIKLNQISDDFFAGGFSYSAWVYCYSLENFGRLMDFANGPSNNNVFVCVYTNGALEFGVFQGANRASQLLTAPGAVTTNQWIHLAVTQTSGGQMTIYKNGVAIATLAGSLPYTAVRKKNYLGQSNWSADAYLNATLSQVTLWRSAKSWTPSDITTPIGGSETGLVGYWKLTDISGTTAPDSSAASNRVGDGTLTATVVGAPLPQLATEVSTSLTWSAPQNVAVNGDLSVTSGALAVTNGTLTVNGNHAVVAKDERVRVIRGIVRSDAVVMSGAQWSVVSAGTGQYDITFTTPFNDIPSVVVAPVYAVGAINGNANGTGGSSNDGAVIVGITATKVRVRVGNSDGNPENRTFTFVAIGL